MTQRPGSLSQVGLTPLPSPGPPALQGSREHGCHGTAQASSMPLSDPCAFSSPRLCKVPESKQHSRSCWNQSGALSTGIAVQLALPSEKTPALPPFPPPHQPSPQTLSPVAEPSALLPLGTQARTRRTRHTHARQPSFLPESEGARQDAGELRPLNLSAAPSSPKCSGLGPESRGR